MENNCFQENCEVDNDDKKLMKSASLVVGLSSLGSAAGLIYGLTAAKNKRWWAVILYMVAGTTLGSGIGYVVNGVKK